MQINRQTLTAVMLSFAAVVGAAEHGFAAERADRQDVLILYGLQSHMPVVMDWDRSIRTAIESGMDEPVRIETEFLDLLRSQDKDYRDQWMALLRKKYQDNDPDVVVAVFDPGLQFVLDHEGVFFPDVPVVFCTAQLNQVEVGKLPRNLTGVTYQLDYLETLRLAQRLRPHTRNVAVVVGSSDVGNEMLAEARSVLSEHPEFRVSYLTGRSVQQLVDEVALLPDDTIILFLVYVRDPQGRHHYANDVLAKVSQSASVPTFAMWDPMLGAGAVGGCMVRIGEQGRMAGEIAVRIMHGDQPASIPISGRESNEVVVDWRELRRWKLDENRLPADALVLYRDESLWQEYGMYMLSAAGVILIQSALIVGLLVNRARRRRAERFLAQSREESRALAGKLITAQEDERKRLARELHDDLSQRLAAQANEAERLVDELDVPDATRVVAVNIREELVALADDVHRISRQLHPSILDDLGLEDALRSECQTLSERQGIHIDFDSRDVPRSLPKAVSLCLYRVAQEALRNAVKHAGTDHVAVTVMADDEFLYVIVQDHGHGFEAAETVGKPGLGLDSMRERVRLVAGQLIVNTQPGGGTTIEARVPHSKS